MEKHEFIYKTCPDGTKIPLDVYYPTESSADVKRPIALFVHAGGWIVGSKDMLTQFNASSLVELGFIAVSIDYRLSPTISPWDGAYTDTKDAYEWCRRELPALLTQHTDGKVAADGDKLVGIGQSAGGPILGALLPHLSTPPKAMMDLYGIKFLNHPSMHTPSASMSFGPESYDPALIAKIHDDLPPPTSYDVFDYTTNSMKFDQPRTAFLFDNSRKGTGFKSVVTDGDYDRLDCVTVIQQWGDKYPPTIIVHGTQDNAVPSDLSRDLFRLLGEKGVETQLVEVEGADHSFDAVGMMSASEEQQKQWKQDLLTGFQFLKKYV